MALLVNSGREHFYLRLQITVSCLCCHPFNTHPPLSVLCCIHMLLGWSCFRKAKSLFQCWFTWLYLPVRVNTWSIFNLNESLSMDKNELYLLLTLLVITRFTKFTQTTIKDQIKNWKWVFQVNLPSGLWLFWQHMNAPLSNQYHC